ncbi:MAG: hypothetical protein ACREPF_12725 [Rhodanobacteraceae bacterium]
MFAASDWLAMHFQKRVLLGVRIIYTTAALMGIAFTVYDNLPRQDNMLYVFLLLFGIGVVTSFITASRAAYSPTRARRWTAPTTWRNSAASSARWAKRRWPNTWNGRCCTANGRWRRAGCERRRRRPGRAMTPSRRDPTDKP